MQTSSHRLWKDKHNVLHLKMIITIFFGSLQKNINHIYLVIQAVNFYCMWCSVCCPHHQLVDRLLQPEADERGQGVVENQQHNGIHKVVPLTVRMHSELPCAGAVALNNGGDAKYTADTGQDKDGQRESNANVSEPTAPRLILAQISDRQNED